MSHRVGQKGQVVIEKGIRDTLGIQPGFVAVQEVVADRVEIAFFPPEHHESLRGILANPKGPSLSEEEFGEVRRQAWARSIPVDRALNREL
jgi:bifunctional DNA-binding transcriptional regulator/antitoxin component of YhaV-PrlF toxin-antitoxin module